MPKLSNHSEGERRRQLTLLWMQAQPMVSAYIASAVRDAQHAEDLIQDTALTIAEKFDDYDSTKAFLPWAIGVAKNKLLHYYRKHRRDRLVFDDQLLDMIGSEVQTQADTIKERGQLLQRCIEKLAASARAILEMRYQRDMNYEQIAQAVDRTPAGVANNLHRSRKALADCVKQQANAARGDA